MLQQHVAAPGDVALSTAPYRPTSPSDLRARLDVRPSSFLQTDNFRHAGVNVPATASKSSFWIFIRFIVFSQATNFTRAVVSAAIRSANAVLVFMTRPMPLPWATIRISVTSIPSAR